MENNKEKSLKNTFKLKQGAYSIIITVVVLALIIAFNSIFSIFAEKYHWEIDMTKDKIHSMSDKNINYLKNIKLKDEVEIIIIAASKSEYTEVMASMGYQEYGVYCDSDYYFQTATIVEKYGTYNNKIKVRFMDSQSTEFTEINKTYSDMGLTYGDILVTHQLGGGEERIRRLAFDDVYVISEDPYTSTNQVTGNNIEYALTNAIDFVLSGEAKKAMVYKGHSVNDNTSNYINLLEINGYDVDVVEAQVLSSVSKDYDIVAILSPSVDFYESELKALSEFLENGGKLNKGLVYFADASSPELPNFNAFLEEWGIKFKDGILFETDDDYHTADSPSQLFMQLGSDTDTIVKQSGRLIAGYNVPMLTEDPDGEDGTAYEIDNVVVTSENAVLAPAGASKDWKPENKDDVGQYIGAAICQKLSYDADNNPMRSYVAAFSSVMFIQSELAEFENSNNKEIVLHCTDIAANVSEGGMEFIPKSITADENFAAEITDKKVKNMNIIFTFGLPILIIAAGVYVIVRRRRA